MATYVNDLRLKEIATGDESGTWGTSTNTNLELIAEGFSYATVDPFDTDADKTETMADGATDPIRSLYLKVTSTATLTATRTLTLAPNTVSKVWIIENATTGSQSISISQGSGSNVTIPNGDVKVIYTDGAGAGAAVTDAFTDLNVGGTLTATNLAGTLTTAAQTNITSVGTLSSLTVSGDLTVDTTTLYVDSTNNRVGIGTTSPSNILKVYNTANSDGVNVENTNASFTESGLFVNNTASTGGNLLRLRSSGSDKVVVLGTGNVGIGTASPSTLLDITTSGGGKFQVTDWGASAQIGVDTASKALRINGTASLRMYTGTAGSQAEAMRIDSLGNVGIGTTSPSQKLSVSTTSASQAILISTSSADSDSGIGFTNDAQTWSLANRGGLSDSLVIRDVTGGADIFAIDTSGNVGIGTTSPSHALQIVGTTTPTLTIGSTTAGQARLVLDGDSNGDGAGGDFAELIHDTAGDLIISSRNPATDSEIIFKNNGSERMRIDSSGRLAINTTDADNKQVRIVHADGTPALCLSLNSGTGSTKLQFGDSGDSDIGQITYDHTSNFMALQVNNSERMRIDSSGNVGIGTTSPTDKLHVGTSSGGTQLKIQSGSGVNNCILHTNGTTDSWRTGMNLALTNGSYEFYDDVNNVDRMVINSSGYVEMASASQVRLTLGNTGTAGTNTANWIRGTGNELGFNSAGGGFHWEIGGTERMRILSSGGLTFNGDTAAANALDDYEEGTWTATLPQGGNAILQGNSYTKVGRLVTVYCQFRGNSTPNDSNTFQVGNLPFARAAGGTLGVVSCARGFPSVAKSIAAYATGSTFQFVALPHNSSGGGIANLLNSDLNGYVNDFDIGFAVTYMTS